MRPAKRPSEVTMEKSPSRGLKQSAPSPGRAAPRRHNGEIPVEGTETSYERRRYNPCKLGIRSGQLWATNHFVAPIRCWTIVKLIQRRAMIFRSGIVKLIRLLLLKILLN